MDLLPNRTINWDRWIANRNPDYDLNNPDPDITSGSELSPTFVAALKSHRNRLLMKHFKEYSSIFDNDPFIYKGKAGVAMLYLKIGEQAKKEPLSENPNDPVNKIDWETNGHLLLNQCLRNLEKKKKKATFISGEAGPLALAAVYGDDQKSVEKLLQLATCLSDPKDLKILNEMFNGRAGYLYALNFVRDRFPSPILDKVIGYIICAMIQSGDLRAKAKANPNLPPLVFEWNGKQYVGIANGYMGILTILLMNRAYVREAMQTKYYKPTIEYVKRMQLPSGNFPYFAGSDTDLLVQWCHGSPGAVHLFIEASKTYPESKDDYLQVAERCADDIWQRGVLKKGYGLCHGVAGNGYAFIALFKATGNPKYLYRAARFAEICFDYGKHGFRVADRPLSLFEGLAGTVYFLNDLLNISEAAFPGFNLDPIMK